MNSKFLFKNTFHGNERSELRDQVVLERNVDNALLQISFYYFVHLTVIRAVNTFCEILKRDIKIWNTHEVK